MSFDEDDDEYDHFVDAQDSVWDAVLRELDEGRKRSHWMWFVFPVLEGVGESGTALFYALRDVEEAEGYLAHPVLGPRLIDCCQRVLDHPRSSAREIFGSTDAWKLHNCATLFRHAAEDPEPFESILRVFFDGRDADRTVDLLGPM